MFLVILTDIRLLRSAAPDGAAREEVPAGVIIRVTCILTWHLCMNAQACKGRKSSVTQFSILSMPGDDIHASIPDLQDTSQKADRYIKELTGKVSITVNVLPSL